MAKKDLIKEASALTGATQSTVENIINSFIQLITKSLKAGKPVQLAGFGTFKKVNRAARKGRNPKTGEVINIPAGVRIKFASSSKLIDSIK